MNRIARRSHTLPIVIAGALTIVAACGDQPEFEGVARPVAAELTEPWPWEEFPPEGESSQTPTPPSSPEPSRSATPSRTPTAEATSSPSPTAEPTPTPEESTSDEPPPELSRMEAMAADVVGLTNARRRAHGCSELRVDERLVTAASAHSEDMARRDYLSHTSPEGDGPGDRTAAAGYPRWSGENIAMGYSTAEAVVDGWMNSEGHRANILNCDSRAVGVGAADSPRGIYWTQKFGYE